MTMNTRRSRPRCQNNPRYSMRAYAKSVGLHPSALSRILARKQLLSVRASLHVAERLRLKGDDKRKRLMKEGLLVEQNGRIVKAHRATASLDDLRTSEARRRSQAEFLRLAMEALHDDGTEHRSMLSLVLAIDPRKVPEAQDRFYRFLNEMADLLESGKQKEVYALNLHFFPFRRSGEKVRV